VDDPTTFDVKTLMKPDARSPGEDEKIVRKHQRDLSAEFQRRARGMGKAPASGAGEPEVADSRLLVS
jgi:hypothetical protein